MAGDVKKGEAALALRLAGATFSEIAETLNFRDENQVRARINAELAKGVAEADRAKHRELATLRYERLLRALWGKAIDPANPEQLPAARASRELIDRIVAVQGAAVPQEVVITNPTSQELMAWIERVRPVELPGHVEEHDPFAVEDAEIVEDGPAAEAV